LPIRAIFVNVITNALKKDYTQEGGADNVKSLQPQGFRVFLMGMPN
jgi:hypothetical protein